MRHRQFVGARIEDAINRSANRVLPGRGWVERIIPYPGYGNEEHLRVLGRVVLVPHSDSQLGLGVDQMLNHRGWRNLFRQAVPGASVGVTVGDEQIEVQADRGGYLDVTIKNHGLTPGWAHVTITTLTAEPVRAPIQVVSSEQTWGLISDLDDTVISTSLPRLFLAAWNSFVSTEGNRRAVTGMARFYQRFQRAHPGAPIVYVSTGAWNTLPFLNRFLHRHGFPPGVLLLTDWGPTNNGFFRSGPDHKRYAVGELARDFPNIKWLLVGDDGQHDPLLYREFAELQPDRVRAIAIRQLTSTEQVLAHGTVDRLQDNSEIEWTPPPVPETVGRDGDELFLELAEVLGLKDTSPLRT